MAMAENLNHDSQTKGLKSMTKRGSPGSAPLALRPHGSDAMCYLWNIDIETRSSQRHLSKRCQFGCACQYGFRTWCKWMNRWKGITMIIHLDPRQIQHSLTVNYLFPAINVNVDICPKPMSDLFCDHCRLQSQKLAAVLIYPQWAK